MCTTGRWRIGTSGWVYPHWRGDFYPAGLRQAGWFDHYARHFDTVEINNTFYRLQAESAFDAWREQAPPGFLYAVKANRYITHVRRLIDAGEPLARFLERAQHVGPALGPILYQLPPRWHANLPRLESFIALLPDDLTQVFEFRDPTWFSPAVAELLRRAWPQFLHLSHGGVGNTARRDRRDGLCALARPTRRRLRPRRAGSVGTSVSASGAGRGTMFTCTSTTTFVAMRYAMHFCSKSC